MTHSMPIRILGVSLICQLLAVACSKVDIQERTPRNFTRIQLVDVETGAPMANYMVHAWNRKFSVYPSYSYNEDLGWRSSDQNGIIMFPEQGIYKLTDPYGTHWNPYPYDNPDPLQQLDSTKTATCYLFPAGTLAIHLREVEKGAGLTDMGIMTIPGSNQVDTSAMGSLLGEGIPHRISGDTTLYCRVVRGMTNRISLSWQKGNGYSGKETASLDVPGIDTVHLNLDY